MGRLRAIVVLVILTPVTLLGIPVQWLAVRTGWRLKRHIPVYWHRLACFLSGVRVKVHGQVTVDRPLLVAANHASWIDIMVLGSVMPLSFVAKLEVASWPVFGLFAKLQRTVFVDRTRRANTGRTAGEIAERLKDGDAMVLFAEGTSNNGNNILRFRTALLGAAREALAESGDGARVWIQPLAIAYTRLHGMPMGRRFRPMVAWYGDMDLAPHLWALLKEGSVDVDVYWGNPIAYDIDSDRKEIAAQAEDAVRTMTSSALSGRVQPDGVVALFAS